MRHSTRTVTLILTPTAIARLILGWVSVLILSLFGPASAGPLPMWLLWLVLAGIVTVIIISAFGVVTEAEHLARRLGDPYGTLVLTLSIAAIEVILISAVMLGPGEHATIARDSVMAVSMIILNLVVGVALVVSGLRHARLQANRTGVSLYLGMLIALLSVAFAFPAMIGSDGAYSAPQSVVVIVLTIALYGFFLLRQMGAQRADFQEAVEAVPAQTVRATARGSVDTVLRQHGTELVARSVLLVAMVLPIVLLSHDMATLLDDALTQAGAPVALSGILIALIVFLPETITTVRAAALGEMQRVSNLCHGALVSTAGLTIPAVLIIGLLTGEPVRLAATPIDLLLLGMTLLLTLATFTGRRLTPLHGAVHLFVFALYGMTVFI
ncbi:MAG TPA: calcium:proton antiporter [Microbacterium sp.]|nr:calcium:proton antiporter [Microbacterium sp.]